MDKIEHLDRVSIRDKDYLRSKVQMLELYSFIIYREDIKRTEVNVVVMTKTKGRQFK